MNNRLVYSGVDWLGEIPSSWKVAKVKNIFNHHKNVVGDKFDEYDRISLTLNGVILRDKDDANGLQPDKFDGYQIVNDEDIIFKLIDLENVNTSRVGRSNYIGITSPAYILLHEKIKTSKYNEYYFINLYYQEVFNNIGGNGVRSAINKDALLNIPLLVPSKDEQIKIANYLDKKVALVDETIANNKKEIELLEEYKQGVLSDILSNFETEIIKLKYLIRTKLQYGVNSSGISFSKDLPRYVRITDIENERLKDNDKLSLPEEEAQDFILKDGDILFARSGGTVGKTFQYHDSYGLCAFAGYLIRAQFDDKELAKYVYNYTNTSYYNNWKDSIFIQSTIQNIGADKYNVMPVILPKNMKKIKEINNELRVKKNKINESINYRKQIIEKLEEYKKSLIYEAVTGKIEVQ